MNNAKKEKIEENHRIGKTRDLLKEIRASGEYFMHRWAPSYELEEEPSRAW